MKIVRVRKSDSKQSDSPVDDVLEGLMTLTGWGIIDFKKVRKRISLSDLESLKKNVNEAKKYIPVLSGLIDEEIEERNKQKNSHRGVLRENEGF